MKKIKRFLLFIPLLFLFISCDYTPPIKTQIEVKVVDKYTAVESRYNFFRSQYETMTIYYLVLANGDIKEVNNADYYKYNVGDNFTITVTITVQEENKK
jgi:hypothetical protein